MARPGSCLKPTDTQRGRAREARRPCPAFDVLVVAAREGREWAARDTQQAAHSRASRTDIVQPPEPPRRLPRAAASPYHSLPICTPCLPPPPLVGACAHRHTADMAVWRTARAQLAEQRAHTHACRMRHGPSRTRAGHANRGQRCPALHATHTSPSRPARMQVHCALLSAAPSAALVRHLLRRTRLPGRTTHPTLHALGCQHSHTRALHSMSIRTPRAQPLTRGAQPCARTHAHSHVHSTTDGTAH